MAEHGAYVSDGLLDPKIEYHTGKGESDADKDECELHPCAVDDIYKDKNDIR
jgi:hypothetical protein